MTNQIVFSTRMVWAIQVGQKNQTRRLTDEDKYHVGKVYEVHEHYAKGLEPRPTGILLLVTKKRWEHLQDICEEDALDEGAIPVGMPRPGPGEEIKMPTEFFKELWDTIHAPLSPSGWVANPKVWVIDFRRIR